MYHVADELKVVIYNKSDFAWAEEHAAKVNPDCLLYLQPEWDKSEKMLPQIIQYVKDNPSGIFRYKHISICKFLNEENTLLYINFYLILFEASGQGEFHSKNKKAIAHYKQANEMLILNQVNEAQNLLESAVKRDKSFDEAILSLVQVYVQKEILCMLETMSPILNNTWRRSFSIERIMTRLRVIGCEGNIKELQKHLNWLMNLF